VSSDDDANLPDVADDYRPDDWLSAAEALKLVRAATGSHRSNITICTRAHAGMVRARADLLVMEGSRRADHEVPKEFWWAEGHQALDQIWATGDFATWINKKYEIKAFGVRFHRDDIARMAPGAMLKTTEIEAVPRGGGRSMSKLWPEWVAELSVYIHVEGIPPGDGTAGADALIDEIEGRLQERGLSAPSRTTLQDTVGAVLRRLRCE
jgi:hypothetical protein